MGPGMFDGYDKAIGCALVLLVVSVPVTLWQGAKLVWWVWSNLRWGTP